MSEVGSAGKLDKLLLLLQVKFCKLPGKGGKLAQPVLLQTNVINELGITNEPVKGLLDTFKYVKVFGSAGRLVNWLDLQLKYCKGLLNAGSVLIWF